MANTTLSIGSASYSLLDQLNQVAVTKSGTSTAIKAKPKNAVIENLGISNDKSSSNTSIFGSVNELEANLGKGGDTLNIFGNVAGSRIELDPGIASTQQLEADGNDSLYISGNLFSGAGLGDPSRTSGSGTNDVNRIFAGGGNDTIRIAGQANDSFIYLGSGNDSLSVTGTASNLDVKGGEGNDFISFFNIATNVSVAGEDGNDTILFTRQLIGDSSFFDFDNAQLNSTGDDGLSTSSSFSTPNIDLGAGNDSLVLGGGTTGPVNINTGIGNDTIQLSGAFDNTSFILSGGNQANSPLEASPYLGGKDRISASPNASFFSSSFSSTNTGGDTLAFGNGTLFTDSRLSLGSGNDSIVFGSNSTVANSTINTGIGSDTLVFGSNTLFYDSTINLGNDSDADRILFSADIDRSSVIVKGAGIGDMLYIGADLYNYDTGRSDFYNGTSHWKHTA